jgi:long-subunit fatty acid transport protein
MMDIRKEILTVLVGIIMSGHLAGQSAYDAIHILENEEGFGTRALAMGGAYVGIADDYSGIYWNPAGLGSIKNPLFHISMSHLQFNNRALFNGNVTDNDHTFSKINSLGFVFPFDATRGSFVMAIGYNNVADYDDMLLFEGHSTAFNDIGFYLEDDEGVESFYPFDSYTNRLERVSSEGGLHHWSIAGAVMLSPIFTVGITASYIHGKEDYRYLFSQTDADNLYNEYPGDFDQYNINQILQSDYNAFGLRIGGMLELSKMLKIGAVLASPSRISVDEFHSMSDELYFDDGYLDSLSESGQWDYTVRTPLYLDFGFSFNNNVMVLAASGRYRDWSQTRFDLNDTYLGDQAYQELLFENDVIGLNYRSTLEYRLGAEVNIERLNTKIRGGYTFIPSPLKNDNRALDKEIISGGVSFQVDRNIDLDITLQQKNWLRESWDNYSPELVTENITLNKFLVGLNYRF